MTITTDDFLGGRLKIRQPSKGYRAGIDPVFLAASIPARCGQTALELGCGTGVAALCLAARVPEISITGVEIHPELAELAVQNAALNKIGMDVVHCDLTALPPQLRARSFDHVFANPPYFRGGTQAQGARGTGRHEETPLSEWIDVAARRLAPRGRMTFILRADRLDEAIVESAARLGSIEILPLAARLGRDASLVIVSAIKGGRTPLRLRASVILHDGPKHLSDGDGFSAVASGVLRDGSALSAASRQCD